MRSGEIKALEIANSFGGATLEKTLKTNAITLPAISKETSEIWRQASEEYAKKVSGKVRVVLGQNVNPLGVWATVELPALKNNLNVTEILAIDPETLVEKLIFKRWLIMKIKYDIISRGKMEVKIDDKRIIVFGEVSLEPLSFYANINSIDKFEPPYDDLIINDDMKFKIIKAIIQESYKENNVKIFFNWYIKEIWSQVSKEYAEKVSGEVKAVIGKDLRPNNIWESFELPALKNNINVTKITIIDPETLIEKIIFIR